MIQHDHPRGSAMNQLTKRSDAGSYLASPPHRCWTAGRKVEAATISAFSKYAFATPYSTPVRPFAASSSLALIYLHPASRHHRAIATMAGDLCLFVAACKSGLGRFQPCVDSRLARWLLLAGQESLLARRLKRDHAATRKRYHPEYLLWALLRTPRTNKIYLARPSEREA